MRESGGESDEGYGKALDDVYVYDHNDGSNLLNWTQTFLHASTTPRVWHSSTCIPHLDMLFIFGGESYSENGGVPNILSAPMIVDTKLHVFYLL